MSNKLQIFNFENSNIRTIIRDNDIWFVAKDVAELLGYKDTDQAIRNHCKCAELLKPVETTGLDNSPRGLVIIPERDVYRLIMKSKLPAAERFEEWVVSEVLPSIRKTGEYKQPISKEVQIAQALIAAVELIKEKEAAIAILEPKAEVYDKIVDATGRYTITSAAKILNMKPKTLFVWLSEHDWIYKRNPFDSWTAYQDKIDSGYMVQKVLVINHNSGNAESKPQVYITSKGLAKIEAKLACNDGE